MSEVTTYRKIIKSGSLFGIVQVGHMLIAIIRSKFLALFIGPAGYGVFALLNSTVDMVRMATGFGLEISSVKNIAEARTNTIDILRKKASTVLSLGFLTGLLGTVLAIVFSKYLSLWTFETDDKAIAIIMIAASILFQQMAGAQSAVMQGMDKLNFLAKTNLYGNLAGLLVTLPLYFFLKVDAIVTSLILSSVINFVVAGIFYKKLNTKYQRAAISETFTEGREILYFGFLLSLSSFLPTLSNYLIQIFISNTSTISNVGFFTIGMAMINSYAGLLFTAMSAEYYPRLATINKEVEKENEAVNQQAVISVLAIIPVIIFFLGFAPFLIKILLTEKFNSVLPLLYWGVLAMFFKAVSFSMGYVIIARGDSKVFIKTALIFNTLYVVFCTSGFYMYGLEGLGVALLMYYAVHFISMYAITRIRYKIYLTKAFFKIFIIGFIICTAGIFLNRIYNENYKEIIFLLLLIVSLIYSLKEIDKRINLKSLIKSYLHKKKNR